MNASKFNVLGYGVCLYLPFLCNSVYFYLFGVLDEFAYNDGMLFGYVCGKAQKPVEFPFVGTYVHCRPREYVAWAYKYRKPYFSYERVDVFKACKLPPPRLVYSHTVKHG